MSEIDDIDRHIVLLHPHAQVLEVFFSALSEWVADKDDDSLPLALVLPVLQGELSNLDSCEHVRGLPGDLDVVDRVNQVSNLIGLSKSQLNSVLTKFYH